MDSEARHSNTEKSVLSYYIITSHSFIDLTFSRPAHGRRYETMYPHYLKTYKKLKILNYIRLARLVGITERETGVGKLGWHGKFYEIFNSIFPIKKKERLVN